MVRLKRGESVKIGDDIKITLSLNNPHAKAVIGVDAPENTRVERVPTERPPKPDLSELSKFIFNNGVLNEN